MSETDDDFTNLRKALKKLQGVHRNLAYACRVVDRGELLTQLVKLKEAIITEAERLGPVSQL